MTSDMHCHINSENTVDKLSDHWSLLILYKTTVENRFSEMCLHCLRNIFLHFILKVYRSSIGLNL